jgi:disulfide bond formation protein DsbB
MAASDNLRFARALALATPLLLLGGAYLGQYAFGLFPCEMCWWQRYAHFAALALAVLAFITAPSRALVALAALALAISALIGAYHAGVEYQWWEGLTACTSTATGKGDNPLDAIMNAPLVRCDVPQWTLFGVSLAGWNFLFSGAAALAIAFLLLRRPRAAQAFQ